MKSLLCKGGKALSIKKKKEIASSESDLQQNPSEAKDNPLLARAAQSLGAYRGHRLLEAALKSDALARR